MAKQRKVEFKFDERSLMSIEDIRAQGFATCPDDVIHHPDVSVVHVAQKDMNHHQALHWSSTIGTWSGREQAFNWLLRNDPMIANLYAKLDQCEIGDADKHLAAVLILVNAMRSQNA